MPICFVCNWARGAVGRSVPRPAPRDCAGRNRNRRRTRPHHARCRESPIAWLARRKARDGRALIEPAQLQAGERLRADFTLRPFDAACHRQLDLVRSPRSPQRRRRDLHGSSARGAPARTAGAGRRRAGIHRGPARRMLLSQGLEDVERERGWPTRSAKVVLQLGLDRLARHYGYAAEARGADFAHVRTWIAPDAAFAERVDVRPTPSPRQPARRIGCVPPWSGIHSSAVE